MKRSPTAKVAHRQPGLPVASAGPLPLSIRALIAALAAEEVARHVAASEPDTNIHEPQPRAPDTLHSRTTRRHR